MPSGFSAWLMRPNCGSRSRIQLSVTVSAGRKNASQNRNSKSFAAGTSVRARSQATKIAIAPEKTWRAIVSVTVFQAAVRRLVSANTVCQPASPQRTG